MSVLQSVRPDILKMKPYQSARSLYPQSSQLCYLDANEYGNKVYSRYPDPQPQALLTKLSCLYGVHQKQILITRGSDEGIDCLIRIFAEPKKDRIAIFEPTYDVYAITAQIQMVETLRYQLDQDFQLADAPLNSSQSDSPKCIFICHPNNPTGNLMSRDKIVEVLRKNRDKAAVIVDEAYIEFSGAESTLSLMSEYDNLIVLRTLSKAYGLAGVRVGVIIAQAEIIDQLRKVLAPYPIATPVTQILLNLDLHFNLDSFNSEKERVRQALLDSPLISKVYPSDANFFLCEVEKSQEILERLLQKGVLIRNRHIKVENTIRVSVGLADENSQLIDGLKSMEDL